MCGVACALTSNSENPTVSRCACLCSHWRHVGICQGEATVLLRISGGEVDVAVCKACADDIGRRYPGQVSKRVDLGEVEE
jgi:hypothetical protein